MQSSGRENPSGKHHYIYRLLDEYSLNQQEHLRQRIREFESEDWLELEVKLLLEHTKSEVRASKGETTPTPLTFWFPCLPPALLPSIASHLLVTDTAWLDDPLYEIVGQIRFLQDRVLREEMGRPLGEQDRWVQQQYLMMHDSLLEDLEACIKFYLRAKQLVIEGRLIPYKRRHLDWEEMFADGLLRRFATDRKLRASAGLTGAWADVFFVLDGLLKSLMELSPPMSMRPKRAWTLLARIRSALWRRSTAPWYFRTFPHFSNLTQSFLDLAVHGPRGQSTDFLSPQMAYVIRSCLEVVDHINATLPPDQRIRAPMQMSQGALEVPLLSNIPLERVLDTILAEWDAFEKYRASLNEIDRLRRYNKDSGGSWQISPWRTRGFGHSLDNGSA